MGSCHSAARWAVNLTSHLLELCHHQWTQRNKQVHVRDAQGLLIQDGIALSQAIESEFSRGAANLLAGDRHYIELHTPGQVRRWPPARQYIWLHGLQLARTLAQESADSDLHGMRSVMDAWLTAGP